MGSLNHMPYWHYNVSNDQRTVECPVFLKKLSEKDRRIVGSLDSTHRPMSWHKVGALVASNRLGLLERTPSTLRRYLAFVHALRSSYGSVGAFVVAERLRWPSPVVATGTHPFSCPDDVTILRNDWPYSLDSRIVHLVVWTKFTLDEDPTTGFLADEAHAQVEEYVDATFGSHVPPNQILWFKNWSALKSVHSVEHFHVLLLNPDPGFVHQVTNGDVALCDRPQPFHASLGRL
ncbi:hypothetical protein CDD82_7240 [Ophiocordyceps australis]|uniref:N-acetylglucosamine-induced protein 1 n=1 Tax=Ophiocordyceps australis TaxID=1399860 RepID=A0A2C5YTA8_9HYPO|nr:hypothetical protein CDD82_7240 [Ophiocordyceps australis]